MIFNLKAQNKVYDEKGNGISITNENVDLEFVMDGVSVPQNEKEIESVVLSLIALLPKAVDLGFKAIGNALKKREKSFTGEYEIQKGNINLGVAQVPSFIFKREVALKGSSENSNLTPAIELKLKAEPVNGFENAMYYAVEYVKLARSKARTTGTYNKLDYFIDIKLSFFITDEAGTKTDKEVVDLNTIKIPYVKFNVQKALKKDQYISDIILLPKGARLAEVGLKIVESNPAKIKAEKISALFEKHQDDIKTVINNILPKVEEDKKEKKDETPKGNKEEDKTKDPNKSIGNKTNE